MDWKRLLPHSTWLRLPPIQSEVFDMPFFTIDSYMARTLMRMTASVPSFCAILIAACLFLSNVTCAQMDDDPEAPLKALMRQLGGQFDSQRTGPPPSGCTLPVWHAGSPNRVFIVPDYAKKSGIAAGDYLYSINGRPVPADADALNEMLVEFPADAYLDIEVYRSGSYEALIVKCEDSADIVGHFDAVGTALLNADPAQCVEKIEALTERVGGAMTSGLAQTLMVCRIALDSEGFRETGGPIVAEVAALTIEQSKYFPGQFRQIRPEIAGSVLELSQLGRDDLADQIQQQYLDATVFVENDEAPPRFE